jgi:hypothetical protein
MLYCINYVFALWILVYDRAPPRDYRTFPEAAIDWSLAVDQSLRLSARLVPIQMAEHTMQFESASVGFDLLFSDKMLQARERFLADDSPFHLAGMGICTFLEAALGMEVSHFSRLVRVFQVVSGR